jgi:hypothetical protein
MDYRDRSIVLRAIGGVLLLAGLGVAFLGPVEVYCFYLFTEGGRFHYEGFGFGSFMFGNIASQIIGYYLIAAILIPLGYGHLTLRRWARPLAEALLWFWLIAGIPLSVLFFFILVASKELTLMAGLAAIIALVLGYAVVPVLLIRFYRGRNVRLTLESLDPHPSWLEKLPVSILVLALLYTLTFAGLHALLFFRGIFPVMGIWVIDLPGFVLIALSILTSVGLLWGTLQLKAWAWWGAFLYFGFLSVSTVVSLSTTSYQDLLSLMPFAPLELDALDGLPLQGIHLAILAGIPLVLTLGLIIASRRLFGVNRNEAGDAPDRLSARDMTPKQ